MWSLCQITDDKVNGALQRGVHIYKTYENYSWEVNKGKVVANDTFLLLLHSTNLVFVTVKRTVPTTAASVSQATYHVLTYLNKRTVKMIAITETSRTKIIFTLSLIITMKKKTCLCRDLIKKLLVTYL